MKKIMILGASILQLPAIEKAKDMGLNVIAVDMNPNAVGFKVDGIIKEVISTIDIPAILKAAKKHKIDGIMTLATDMPMRSVAAVAKELKLVGIDEATAVRATNKVEMRRALMSGGLSVPQFFNVDSDESFLKVMERFKDNIIVKPADSSGSRGICLINSGTEPKKALDFFHYSKSYSPSGNVVVEEYMKGPEVSVETISVDGECHVVQITDKLTTGVPHFVEMGHSQPTILCKEKVDAIKNITKSANKAIGIKDGPSHTEVIVTREGPKIVEIGARLGGDSITTHLVPLSTGVDMVEGCIKIALGEKPDITPKYNRGSAIRYFRQNAGVIRSIKGIEEVRKISHIKQVSIVHGVGERITEIDSSGSRMGFVIADGDTAESAIEECERALSEIEVVIE